MNQKESGTFFKDFQSLQKEMETIGKNQAGYNYKYADIEQVWEKIRALVLKHNFIVTTMVNGGYVHTNVIHKDGKELISAIEISQADPQKKGAEITYYRRYNLLCLFNIIIAGEDNDAADAVSAWESKLLNIDNIEDLQAFYLENKGEGKAFTEAVSKKKKELQS